MTLIHRDHSVTIEGVTLTLGNVPLIDRPEGPVFRGPDSTEIARMAALGLVRAGVRSGDAFRRVRHALGLQAADVAALLDVRPETLSAWETGKASPDRDAFAVLAAMLRERMGDPMTTREHLARMVEPLDAVRVEWNPGDRVAASEGPARQPIAAPVG